MFQANQCSLCFQELDPGKHTQKIKGQRYSHDPCRILFAERAADPAKEADEAIHAATIAVSGVNITLDRSPASASLFQSRKIVVLARSRSTASAYQ